MESLTDYSKSLGKRFLKFVTNSIDLKPSKKIKLKDIFNEYWNDFLTFAKSNNIKLRDVVLKEVDRIICCGSLSEGYYTYVCKDCDKVHYSPFHCHSRFCPSCGIKSILVKSNKILKMLIKYKHRHVVFTIPEELRPLFRKHRKNCIDILFDSVNDTINYIVKSATRKYEQNEDYVPGFISTLHTFGRDLKWNPHIHVILAECVLGKNTIYKPLFIPYEQIRKSFQNILLKNLENHFGKPTFRALKNKIYSHTQDGFYIYAKHNPLADIRIAVSYVIRYHGRPAIAESRILSMDNMTITFWYDRHEDGKRVVESLHVFEFFKRLIVHIPDEFSNTIRYYGFYNKPLRQFNKMLKLFSDNYFKARECLNNWRNRLRYYFNYDPLICKYCGKKMQLLSITVKSRSYIFDSC